jgi:hypothetical protein
MKLLTFFIFSVVILHSCLNNYNSNLDRDGYPNIVITNNVKNLYDKAKWIIYSSNYHYDGIKCFEFDPNSVSGDKYYISDYKVDSINIVCCSLKLDKLKIDKDTTAFIFSMYYKDTLEVCIPKQKAYQNTVIFIKGDDFIYRTGEYGYNAQFLKQQKELENDTAMSNDFEKVGYFSLKKENILFAKFIRETKYPLHPWLKEEAIKRGILKE